MITIDKDTGLTIYESVDEIPDHFFSVPPINMDGLPKTNMICRLMDCVAQISDTYPEYVMQAAFVILSTIARRRIFMSLNGSRRYAIVWMDALGQSGYARKTVSISITRKILKAVYGDVILLPDDVTPEGLLDVMATKVLIKSKEGHWDDISSKYADSEGKILKSQRPYIRDEVSQMYAQMMKPTNAHQEQMLLKLHNGESYEKALVMKRQIVEDPFFPMFLATTAEGFIKFMTKNNVRSGFVARKLITNPTYEKTRKSLQEDNEGNGQLMSELINDFKLIDAVLGYDEPELRAGFQEGVLEMLDAWVAERETYYMQKHDEDHGVFIPRFQENAVAMALLIEIGNIPSIVDKDMFNLLEDIKISANSMAFALKLLDSVFAPYIDSLNLRDDPINTFENCDVAKIERLLIRHRKASHTTIMRNTKLKSTPLEEALYALHEAGLVERCFVQGREKSRWYNYIPPDPTKIKFENDYRVLEIPQYECGMTFVSNPKPKTGLGTLMDIPSLNSRKETERTTTEPASSAW